MTQQSVDTIIRKLNDADVRYLIAGGLAVVAHGYLRFTADVDLILDLDADNLNNALPALASLGYVPRAPVPLESFLDPSERNKWIREKGLTVFSLHSAQHPATEVDLFVESPFDFDKAYGLAHRAELSPGLTASFVSLDDLVKLKEKARRPRDLDDLEHLRRLRGGAGK